MLDHKEVARLPERVTLSRNGRAVEARRVALGDIEIAGHALTIADAVYEDFPPLPVRVPDGRHAVHAYQWDHPRGPISVCVVVQFRAPRLAVTRRLAVFNDGRPDLTAGVVVDSAEVQVRSASRVVLPSGLGDGYYPVVGVYNFGLFPQAIVLDFEVWRVREYVLLPGQVLDEYGIVRRVGPNDS